MKVLLTIGKLGTRDDFINKAYQNFSSCCLKSKPDIASTKRDFLEVSDLFVRSDRLDLFCDETAKLSEQLRQSGNSRLSDMLINELGKMCLSRNRLKKAEEYLYLALENSREKNDGLHELARLNDLEKIYKEVNNKKLLVSILGQKKRCCKRIIQDYEEASSHFDTISKAPASKAKVKTQLAFAYSDLADILCRNKPLDAIKMYEKSKDIYKDLEMPKEVAYLENKIKWLKDKYCSLYEQ